MAKKDKIDNELSETQTDPDFHKGFGEFTFPNGDSYVGDYCAHRSGLLWREGRGVYTTQDGQIYEGEWYDDKLVENKEIVVAYPNGAQYQGPISKNKYHGPGTYTLESNMNISCQFVGNKPVGSVTLIDCQGKLWRGTANENSVILLPENVFYLNLNEFKGKGLPRTPIDASDMHPTPSQTSRESDYDLPDRLWEQVIFAKSQLTKNDMDFTDSSWWKNYVRYKEKYDQIQSKIEENLSLTDDELKWVQQFKSFKNKQESRKYEKQLVRMKEEERVFALNEIYQSKDFQNSCRPVKIFYPQSGRHQINEKLSSDGTIEGNEEIDPLGSRDIIFINSAGRVATPAKLPVFDNNFVLESSSIGDSSISQNKEDDLIMQFHEFVQQSDEIKQIGADFGIDARESIRPDVFRQSIPDTQQGYYDDVQEVLHFTKFREEMLLAARKDLEKEKKYQEEKQQKTHLEKRSKDSVESKIKLRSNEIVGKSSGSKSKVQSTKISDQPSTTVSLRYSTPEKDSHISSLVRDCIEKLQAGNRKVKIDKKVDTMEKVHTHDIGSTTESLGGIPRALLLKSKFRKKKQES